MDKQEIQAALNKKIDLAWEEYYQRICTYSPNLIFNRAQEIAATEQAYKELRNGNYPADMLEYLLRFANPLEVVRDQWLDENNVAVDEEMTHALWSIMDRREAEQNYELDPAYHTDEPVPSIPEPVHTAESLQTIKFYYPASVSYYERNAYGDMDYEPTELSPRNAASYLDEILGRISKEQDDSEMERGLMVYYHGDDSVNRKIYSAKPSAEVIDGKLYGVAVCRVNGSLTGEEIDKFKEEWSGQMSDGYGEGFEQRGIRCRDGNEIYVSFWSADDDWSMQTLEELRAPQMVQAPMDVPRFWSIIEQAGKGMNGTGSIEDSLTDELLKCELDDIVRFSQIFDEFHAMSERWLLWSAGEMFAGGLSDDGFSDFRSWLVGRGQQTYERVMEDPDTLALTDRMGNLHEPGWDADDQYEPIIILPEGFPSGKNERAAYAAASAYETKQVFTCDRERPDFYTARNAAKLPALLVGAFHDSITMHPHINRRVENQQDAERFLPRCLEQYGHGVFKYGRWNHPVEECHMEYELPETSDSRDCPVENIMSEQEM